jgi:hypothetical protein
MTNISSSSSSNNIITLITKPTVHAQATRASAHALPIIHNRSRSIHITIISANHLNSTKCTITRTIHITHRISEPAIT